MADVSHLEAALIAARLAEVRSRIRDAASLAGRQGSEVEVLLASKYVGLEQMPILADAGVQLVGENRAQALAAKASAYPNRFTWDFIGALQSRRVREILPHVRLIHSLASESAARQLARFAHLASPSLQLLIEVNVSGQQGKAGIAPHQIDQLIEVAPFPVTGLMTMPPASDDPEQSRRHFAALRELAAHRGLQRLSMGTSQDYLVAVQEGATIVRLGRSLLT